MALINCPECGRGNLSSEALACPNCGYPIKDRLCANMRTATNSEQVVFYEIYDGKSKVIFDKGLENGTHGNCIERMATYDYYVEEGVLYVKRPVAIATYLIVDGYLLSDNGKYNGYIPDGTMLNISCTRNNPRNEEDAMVFFFDGGYSEISDGNAYKGTYKRENSFLLLSGNNTGHKPVGYVIYNNCLYFASYVAQNRVGGLQKLFQRFNGATTQNVMEVKQTNTSSASKMHYDKETALGAIVSVGAIVIAILMLVVLLKSCNQEDYNSNDGKCDACGKTSYTKLSDGNEYCYKCYKEAIDYYLDD